MLKRYKTNKVTWGISLLDPNINQEIIVDTDRGSVVSIDGIPVSENGGFGFNCPQWTYIGEVKRVEYDYKFKVGDKVKIVEYGSGCSYNSIGSIVTIESLGDASRALS